MSSSKTAAKYHQFEGQHQGEDVLLAFRRHIVVLRKSLIIMLLMILLGTIPLLIWPLDNRAYWGLFAGLFLGFLVVFYNWIGWFYSVFIVSNLRFIQIKQKGFFNRSVIDLGLDKIQNINYSIDGMQQTILKFGTIVVQTFVGDLVLSNIGRPQEVHEQLLKIVKEHGKEIEQTKVN